MVVVVDSVMVLSVVSVATVEVLSVISMKRCSKILNLDIKCWWHDTLTTFLLSRYARLTTSVSWEATIRLEKAKVVVAVMGPHIAISIHLKVGVDMNEGLKAKRNNDSYLT